MSNVTSKKLATLLDYAIRRYLQADPPLVASSLKTMSGKVVALSLSVPQLELFLLIKENTIRVCADYHGVIDTRIRGSLFDLLKFGMDKEMTQPTTQLEIIGDIQLGQRLQHLLTEIEFDWEELLTPVIGDIATHQISEGLRMANNFVSHGIESLSFSSGEFLQEELKIVPTQREITYFIDHVEQLRDAVERLDAKFNRIENE